MLIKYRWYGLFALVALCAALYWSGLRGPFLFDDFPNLSALTSIDHLDSWRALGIYLSQPRGFPGRPLAMLSFLLQKGSWPDNPFPFKLVNLGLHLFCGLLVYRLTAVLASSYPSDRTIANGDMRTGYVAALLATAAWLLNPIQISGVLLVVQRMTLLMAMCVLLGLLAYLKGLLDEHGTALRRAAWMALGLGVCMLLAVLCKENGILLPLYALILDITVLRHRVAQLPRSLQWWRRLLIWPTVIFVFGYLMNSIPQCAQVNGLRDFTCSQRLLTEPRVLLAYLDSIFLPRFGLYGLYHDGFTVSHGLLSPWSTLPAMLAILGAAICGILTRRRYPLIALAILWYLGGQVLESSTIMLELYFEHRNYVPIIGPFVAIAIGFTNIQDATLRKKLSVVAALWLVTCALTTGLSTDVYKSEDRLALAWASKQPESIRAQTMLADRLTKHGQLALALKTIESTLAKHPDNSLLAENRVYLKCMQGTLKPADMAALTKLLQGAPFDRGGFENVDALRVLAGTGHCAALNAQSWQNIVHALLGNPHYANGVSGGFLHYQLHQFAVTHGDLDTAIRELNSAYADDPDANIPRLQAQYLVSAGLYQQAIKILQTTDYHRLPILRRLLVDDRAINEEAIEKIRRQQEANTMKPPVSDESSKKNNKQSASHE